MSINAGLRNVGLAGVVVGVAALAIVFTLAVPVAASEDPPPFTDSLVPGDVEIQEFDPLLGQDIEPAGSTAPWALGSAVLALLALGSLVFMAQKRP